MSLSKRGIFIEKEIYIDVLILTNTFVNYFIFAITKRFLKKSITKKRIITASILGGLYSLIVLLNFSVFEFVIIKTVMALTLTFILFGFYSLTSFIKNFLCFIGVNALFAGIMYFLYSFIKPYNMLLENGVVYFNISASTLAIYTIITYAVLTVISFFYSKNENSNVLSTIKITCNDTDVEVIALYDTGNNLTDIFTGLPIIVCEYDSIKSLFPEYVQDFFKGLGEVSSEDLLKFGKKTRIIPASTISGCTSLPAFAPDKTVITTGKKSKAIDVIIAVTNNTISSGEHKALLSKNIL